MSLCKPDLLCFNLSELKSLATSPQYCGWLAKASPAFKGLLSDQLTKLTEDINCNKADRLLKNIIAPVELLTQLFHLATIRP